jgi:exosortase
LAFSYSSRRGNRWGGSNNVYDNEADDRRAHPASARVKPEHEDEQGKQGQLRSPKWSKVGPALLAGSGLFAYHRLTDYDATAGARSAMDGVEGFFFSPAVSSPTLLLILAAWFIFRRRDRLAIAMLAPPGPFVGLLGLILVAAAALLCLWAHYVDVLGLMIPSISIMLLGGSIFLGGWPGGKAMLLPSLFLVLAFPHPAVALNAVIFPMQLMTSVNTAWLLQWGRLAVIQFGDLIFVANGTVFQVIESCAGLRSTETLAMTAVMYNEVFYRTGRRALLLVLSSPVIGIAVNHLRVLSITLNPYSSLASVHTIQGIAMLVVGVLLLAALDECFGKLLPKSYQPPWPQPGEPKPTDLTRPPIWRPLTILAVFLLLGLTTMALPTWKTTSQWQTPISSISPKLGGKWQAQGLPLDEQFLGSVGFTEWMHRLYSWNRHEVEVFVGSDNRLEPRMSLISEKNGVPGPGYDTIERKVIRLGPKGEEVHRRVLRSKRGTVLTYEWYVGVASFRTELLRSTFALDRGPWRRTGRGIVVRVSTPMPRQQSEWNQQEAYLAEVAAYLLEELHRLESPEQDS